MKQCIIIMVCLMGMGVGTAMANDVSFLQRFEQRTLMPYPTVPTVPVTTKPIEKMPFVHEETGPHFVPYLRIEPNPDGRGFGTDFGINFGWFRSHGLGFGIDLY